MTILRAIAIAAAMLAATATLTAADTKRIKGTYTYVAPENVTLEQARATALHRAMTEAIADEFGTMVTQASTTMLRNLNGISTSDFFTTGGSEVNGEWIRTIGEPTYDIAYADGMLSVTATVEGLARAIDYAPVTIKVTLPPDVSRPDESRDVFHSGDDLYVHLQVPVDGYAAIYLVGNDRMAYRLMPHPDTPGYAGFIARRQPRLYFHRAGSRDSEFYYSCDSDGVELNRIYVLFSPDEFVLPVETVPAGGECGDMTPPSIGLREFAGWVSDQRVRDRRFQCSVTDVMVLPAGRAILTD